jgi:hypothetical protein
MLKRYLNVDSAHEIYSVYQDGDVEVLTYDETKVALI